MNTVLIPAAGRGTRIGGPTPKQYLEVAGISILARSLRNAQACDLVDAIVVATGAEELDRVRSIAEREGISKLRQVVVGGELRQDSVARALAAVTESGDDIVAVHDAVRPFASPSLFGAVISRARVSGAAIAAQLVPDTVKQVDGDRIVGTIDRSRIVLAQTPQAFRYSVLKTSIAAAMDEGWIGTDEASIVERAGYPVTFVEGSPFNIKVTRADDLIVAEAFARHFDESGAPSGKDAASPD